MTTRDFLVHTKIRKILHLHIPGSMDELRHEILIADIVPRGLVPILVRQTAHLGL